MGAICITLGHNSSALYINGLRKPIGYEEERISRRKSDSAFPIQSLLMIKQVVGDEAFNKVTTVYISHWFDNFDFRLTESKYFSAATFHELFPTAQVFVTNEYFSHHDAHAYSSLAFYENYKSLTHSTDSIMALVVDGFGNNQEVATAYHLTDDNEFVESHKVRGYDQSLGLLYQYAATSVNLDGINDVYKLLGYRVHVNRAHIQECDELIQDILEDFDGWDTSVLASQKSLKFYDSAIDLEYLAIVRAKFESYFTPVIDQTKMYDSRCRVGYVVQKVLESVILKYVAQFEFDTLLLSGGCFYNVRLNDVLRRAYHTKKICVMPLAGDQGAAIGMYRYFENVRVDFDNLCFGLRPDVVPMIDDSKARSQSAVEALPGGRVSAKIVSDLIASGAIVNIMLADMEFGPRALCRTSSLSLPRQELVYAINSANGRNTVMPMAPAMLADAAVLLFNGQDLLRTLGSDKFMITAHNFVECVENLKGVMHEDIDETFSGRPQIITKDDNEFMHDVLTNLRDAHGIHAVINTSLNIHGEPIIFSIDDYVALNDRWAQDCQERFYSFVITR